MATLEVIVAIALGFPALIIASAALYLQWALRSPLDRHYHGDAEGIVGFSEQTQLELYELPGDYPASGENAIHPSLHQTRLIDPSINN